MKTTLVSIPTYFDADRKLIVEFHPVAKVPGFSHRVFIRSAGDLNALCRDWLGNNFKPSKGVAKFYLAKHADLAVAAG